MENKKFFIPYIIEGVPAYKTLCITSKDVKSFHLNGKEISIIFVPTDDPKVYKDVVRFQWQELANRANETRCKVPDDKEAISPAERTAGTVLTSEAEDQTLLILKKKSTVMR